MEEPVVVSRRSARPDRTGERGPANAVLLVAGRLHSLRSKRMDYATSVDDGIRRLERDLLPSGGFGYRRGGEVFVEPTALALLAVSPDSTSSAPSPTAGSLLWKQALETLVSFQKPQGFFGSTPRDPDPSWTTSSAFLALLAHGRRKEADAAGRWLVQWRAPEKPFEKDSRNQIRKILRIDTAIGGWPWQVGEAFATVEPTALAAIALRAWDGAGAQQRIDEAKLYLADRACHDGGWNYGNPYFYDDVLPPITLPTAKGLLAAVLCGTPRRGELAARGERILSKLLEANPSRKAHAWGALAFAAVGDHARAAQHAERAIDPGDGRGPWGGAPDATALSVLALRAAGGRGPDCLTLRSA